MLTDEQKLALVSLARRAVEAQVKTGRVLADARLEGLPLAQGAFVTIKRRGELRGCLGTLECRASLDEEVIQCAAHAASQDPRFAPVSTGELDDLSIEVSVLGPLEPIDPGDATAITIGTHGLVVEQGHRRGLLLPQVATEWGWDAAEFLRQTCVKAGLPRDAWRSGAHVYRFAAVVFGE